MLRVFLSLLESPYAVVPFPQRTPDLVDWLIGGMNSTHPHLRPRENTYPPPPPRPPPRGPRRNSTEKARRHTCKGNMRFIMLVGGSWRSRQPCLPPLPRKSPRRVRWLGKCDLRSKQKSYLGGQWTQTAAPSPPRPADPLGLFRLLLCDFCTNGTLSKRSFLITPSKIAFYLPNPPVSLSLALCPAFSF